MVEVPKMMESFCHLILPGVQDPIETSLLSPQSQLGSVYGFCWRERTEAPVCFLSPPLNPHLGLSLAFGEGRETGLSCFFLTSGSLWLSIPAPTHGNRPELSESCILARNTCRSSSGPAALTSTFYTFRLPFHLSKSSGCKWLLKKPLGSGHQDE